MTADQRGFIPVIGDRPFQGAFLPVLAQVRDRLSLDSVRSIHSVYVYGSIAAGRAVPGCSDLDLSLIMRRPLSDREAAVLDAIRLEIDLAHPVISKVDFDMGLLKEVTSEDAGMAWRYWIRHHCRCLVGEDLADGIALFRPSMTLALAVNGDFERVLGDYRNALLVARSDAIANRLVREASRKLIRSTNVLRSEDDPCWPGTLAEHAQAFRCRYPAQGEQILYFLEQAITPDIDPVGFTRRLGIFVSWMAGIVRDQATSRA
ncbi:conserved hypothetical protein [Aurantimonas manganoxydans SI85-9A1]|uniref:Polymerase nucleotidyl transferase domain-containing protein n=1 Tax=Aurantimonas manganoxydans (strain ATCC BAA-1229 / DSM 21871 / SI85-9A1) TaxID=287752 RepID=Q1YM34_AURMS|nr:nucleotidyltransferase domain-containing protein [Aurantimonas manganoxydans]EAS51547.1 conserved hypothetical protein [Aurantimonas manganoxydans SI85-9A1]